MGHRPKSYNLLSTVNKKVDSPTKPVIDKDLLRELVSGAQKIFENAESLFNEARLLKLSLRSG
jgi:hypothetical protein